MTKKKSDGEMKHFITNSVKNGIPLRREVLGGISNIRIRCLEDLSSVFSHIKLFDPNLANIRHIYFSSSSRYVFYEVPIEST